MLFLRGRRDFGAWLPSILLLVFIVVNGSDLSGKCVCRFPLFRIYCFRSRHDRSVDSLQVTLLTFVKTNLRLPEALPVLDNGKIIKFGYDRKL